MTEGATAMSTLLTDLSSFLTSCIKWMGDLIGMVEAQPLLLIFVYLAFAVIISRLVRRWLPGV